MVQNNFKESFINLIKNNRINGRITTYPFNETGTMKTELSFSDIYYHDGIATFIDDPEEDRAETAGCFKLDLSEIYEVHYTDDPLKLDGLYGKYDVLLYLGKDYDKEILITFNMNKQDETPFVIDQEDAEKEPLYFHYAKESIINLDYFLGKPVKINLSGFSYQSRYDADECAYSNPIFASLEIDCFYYTSELIDEIPCITIYDKANSNIKVNLNAIGSIHRCNDYMCKPDDKRVYQVSTELFNASIMDKDYKYPSEVE